VVALNRAVAVAQVHGPAAGIREVNAIRNRGPLESYYLLYAVLAEFESRLDRFEDAAANLRKAIQLTPQKSERAFLSRRLQQCEARRSAEVAAV
jgi:RNA polymerase sigma-70 factor (ECF subfamily)